MVPNVHGTKYNSAGWPISMTYTATLAMSKPIAYATIKGGKYPPLQHKPTHMHLLAPSGQVWEDTTEPLLPPPLTIPTNDLAASSLAAKLNSKPGTDYGKIETEDTRQREQQRKRHVQPKQNKLEWHLRTMSPKPSKLAPPA